MFCMVFRRGKSSVKYKKHKQREKTPMNKHLQTEFKIMVLIIYTKHQLKILGWELVLRI